MRSVYEQRLEEAREIEGRILQGRDVFVRTTKFARVCYALWPGEKVAAKLAAVTGKDERTAKRWLSGEFEPPIAVALLVLQEIFPNRK